MACAYHFLLAKERLYATLAPDERAFAERLLQLDPKYRYDRSGLPKLNPVPAAGLASAVAAARVVPTWIRAILVDRAEGAKLPARPDKTQSNRDADGRSAAYSFPSSGPASRRGGAITGAPVLGGR